MKLRRDLASVPLRTGEETWDAMIELITGPGSVDKEQLVAASSIMAMLISDEIHDEEPITLTGGSARVVLYCTFGADALVLGEEIDPLPINPTEDDWRLYVPCSESDIDWASRTLAERAPRITLHKPGARSAADEASESASKGDLAIDWGAFG